MPPDPLLSVSSHAAPPHGLLPAGFEPRVSADDSRHDSTSAAAVAATAAASGIPPPPSSASHHSSAAPLSALYMNRGPPSLMDMPSAPGGSDATIHNPSLSSPSRRASHASSHTAISSLNPAADPYRGPSTDLRDGRVRNPVPSKLQNQTNIKDGNFSVMHMERTGARPPIDERDLAAKRSSEATQAAAMDAYNKGYQSIKRGRQTWRPSSPDHHAHSHHQHPMQQQQQHVQQHGHVHPNIPFDRPVPSPNYMMPPPDPSNNYRMPQAPQASQAPQMPQAPPVPQTPPAPQGSLGPSEVKDEQARLLRHLRGLHPLVVVDQLCKAIAHYGGIPGAPPPTDCSSLPSSEHGNGNGALAIGWLSEIFPIPDPSQPQPLPFPSDASLSALGGIDGKDTTQGQATGPAAGGDGVPEAPVRRARGRPKGSKSTKTRKDKGMKKGQRAAAAAAAAAAGTEYGQDGAPQTSHEAGQNATPADAQSGTPVVRKRGRPKGSKNRPKPPAVPETPQDKTGPNEGGSTTATPQEQQQQQQSAIPQADPQQQHAQFASSFPQQQQQQQQKPDEASLSMHAQNWTDPPTPAARPDDMTGLGMTRKRSSDNQPPFGSGGGSMAPQLPHGLPTPSDYQQPKRRRFSGDAHPSPAGMVIDAAPHSSAGSGTSQSPQMAAHTQQQQQQQQQPQPPHPHQYRPQQPSHQGFAHPNGVKPFIGMSPPQQPQQQQGYFPHQQPRPSPGHTQPFGSPASGLMGMQYGMAGLQQQQQQQPPHQQPQQQPHQQAPGSSASPPPGFAGGHMNGMYDVFNRR